MKNALTCAALLFAAAAAAQPRPAPKNTPPPAPAPSAAPQPVRGAADTGLGLQFALKAGGTVAFSRLSAALFAGVELGYALPVLNRQLSLGVELGYGQPGRAADGTSSTAGAYSYQLSQRLLTFAIDATFTLPAGPLVAYAGAGWGAYHLRAEVESFGMTNVETQLRSGLQVRGGAGLGAGPGTLFGELRAHYVGLEFLSTGEANGGGVTGAVGYRLKF